ncbi:MAG: cysteine--tRNA ligase [Candidatus Omnitrophica bacterium]|nr:cysteine--tRNA ligase [Candidatus Omnitrophota bacterium]
MSISIYNSLTRKKEIFQPLNPQEIKMYVCGPTVYDVPHIGHARSAYIFDVIRRYLIYKGYKVKFVRNVTDVDDKIIEKARTEFKGEDINIAVKKVAVKYLDAYHEALKELGIGSDSSDIIEPKASEYIGKMIGFIKGLIDKGAAYPAGADVYFDITKAKNYGKLSNQALDKMEAGARVSPTGNKNDPLDFALWKSAKENEPSWESPWGRGRPGWHIECSVMSSDILGSEFDIHGGGIDLIFPHHENEIAQSEGAGCKFARYWIHHGLLTINGQKMAKSLGNFITVEDILKYPADVLKLFFLRANYGSPVDFSWDKMKEEEKNRQSFEILFSRIEKLRKACRTKDLKTTDFIKHCENNFIEAMDDNFHTPGALAAIFDLISNTHKFLDGHINDVDGAKIANAAEQKIKELCSILGLSLNIKEELDSGIAAKIDERNKARKRGYFKEADRIRKELEGKGVILEDSKDGTTTWRRKL